MISHQSRLCRWIAGIGLVGCWLLAAEPASAGNIAMNINSISGHLSLPGFPNAVSVDSVQFSMNQLVDHRQVDADSTALGLALGKPIGDVQILFYKTSISESFRYLSITAHNALETGFQVVPQGNMSLETDTFSTLGPHEERLRIRSPSAGGGAGGSFDVSVESVNVDDSSIVVSRTVDDQTPMIQSAFSGSASPSADLLFYDDNSHLYDEPISFTGMTLVSQVFDPLGGPGSPETDTFSYTDFAQPVPEPASATLLALGAAMIVGCRKHRFKN